MTGRPKPAIPGKSSRAWDALEPPLAEWTLEAVQSMGFARMTPVQASTIPLFMGHKDVVVEAVTGSGKTLSFVIPVVERLLRLDDPPKRHHVASIIISPTRELATQIYGVLQTLLAFHGPSAAAARIIGKSEEEDSEEESTDAEEEVLPTFPESALKVVPQLLVGGNVTTAQDLSYFLKHSPNTLISTPGRLLELLSSPHVHCPQSSFEVLVLDEADRLLDLGFKEDLQKILGRLPKQRRTGLFSASVSEAVDQIVRVGLRNPVKIAVKVKSSSGGDDQKTPASLKLRYLTMPASHKLPTLSKLLHSLDPTPGKTIVYLSTCAAVDYFQHVLPAILPTSPESFALIPLHGKHPPNVRQKNFTRFTTSTQPAILLTTDVAARGLDIPQVDLVVQIDPPSDPKVFIHRCGRAGRAGRKGLSVIFLQSGGHEEDYVDFLAVRQTPITPLTSPSDVTAAIDSAEIDTAASKMRAVVLADRALHDKAQRGFVSWVQAYSKHHASSIFRVAELDWADLGQAWGLLRLPKMPELRKWEGDRKLGLKIDFETYAYRDKAREQQRIIAAEAMLAERKAREEQQGARDSNGADGVARPGSEGRPGQKRAWSQKLDAREERERRRVKRTSKRDKERWEKMTPEEREKQVELERMIEQVKQSNMDEFNGFD